MISQLRLALRSLLRTPVFLITAIVSLSLAIGGSVAAFSMIDAIRLRALPFPDAGRLVILSEVPATPGASGDACRNGCDVRYTTYDQILKRYPFHSLDAIGAFNSGAKSLNTGGDAILLNGGVLTPTMFALLNATPLRGRVFTAEDDRLGVPLTAILSYAVWVNQLGRDPEIIGKDIKLSDSHYTVIGVMPPEFRFEVNSDFWLPAVPTLDPSTRPSIRSVNVIGRLAPGRTLAQLRAEVAGIETIPTPGEKTQLIANPLRDRYAGSTDSHDLVFGAIVACVLLIACANLANLVLVRTIRQQREYAIRAALGANPARLARGVMLQNGIIVVAATVLGVALAASALGVLRSLPVLSALRPAGMDYHIDLRVLGFAVLVAAIAGVAITLVPARVAIRGDVQHLLRTTDRSGGGTLAGWIRQGFVVAQVASATVLASGAFFMTRTAFHYAQVDLGFDDGRLISAGPSYPHPWRVPEIYLPITDRIYTELGRIPGVASVAIRATQPIPSKDGQSSLVVGGAAEALPRGQAPGAAQLVSPGYFASVGVRLRNGRDFTEHDDSTSMDVAIVNQWAAQHWWPDQSPIGRSIRFAKPDGTLVVVTVVGIVADSKAAQPNLLLAEEGPELYLPYAQSPSPFPQFLVQARSDPAPLVRPVRLALTGLVPDRPLFTALVRETADRQLSGVRSNAWQIGGFALVGLFLTVIGVYGVLAFDTGRRSREIGIRNALGAHRSRIVREVLQGAGRLAALGVLIGVPLATVLMKVIRGLLQPGQSTDPTAYAVVALGVMVASLLAALAPALRASRISPVVAMQSE